ncbi:MAG: anhydro-N-acetylmuramic acid kinase [Acetobacteraceae bacterium]
MSQPDRLALGLISGTSMDGIDAALIETDGELVGARRGAITLPYPPALRTELLAIARDPARATEPLDDIEAAVTQANAVAARAVIQQAGLTADAVAVVGFHGQTVLHRPERRFTRQIGDGALLAWLLGIDVIAGFRLADVAAGGQGAPLAPLYHAALARDLAKPLAVLNLGGVANVTFLDGATVTAFDTGPASAMIDDWVRRHTGRPFDEDGRIAASGQVDQARLARLLAHPFFALRPPKSLDRNDFPLTAIEGLSLPDGAATLAAFTVASIAASRAHLPASPRRWLVTGGGRHNATLMTGLAAALAAPVEPVESVGWDGDALEAELFGFLAIRSLRGLPLSLPSTTGVPAPMPGGVIYRAG